MVENLGRRTKILPGEIGRKVKDPSVENEEWIAKQESFEKLTAKHSGTLVEEREGLVRDGWRRRSGAFSIEPSSSTQGVLCRITAGGRIYVQDEFEAVRMCGFGSVEGVPERQ